MTEMILSLFNPNSLLPHRAGVAGLALALSAIDQTDALVRGAFTEDEVRLNWDCTDKEAIQWLLSETYQIKDGYLNVKALKLDEQSRYVFTEGIMRSFLQHGQQKIRKKNAVTKTFHIDEGQKEISNSFQLLEECYFARDEYAYQNRKSIYEKATLKYEQDLDLYQKGQLTKKPKKPKLKEPFNGFKSAFNKKGKFNVKIDLKGNHIPGLEADFTNGCYKESPEGFIPLLFLPLACHYYQLPGFLLGLVIPSVINLKAWVRRRKAYQAKSVKKLTSYGEFRANGGCESALRFLLKETLIDDTKNFKINYCEVYQLGKQPWYTNQPYLKQEVYRVHATEKILQLYQNAWSLFPSRVYINKEGETKLIASNVLPWIADNLIANDYWYANFFSFSKKKSENKGLQVDKKKERVPLYKYELKGLIGMTKVENVLTSQEQIFFDSIQGAFSNYLRGQIEQVHQQGRRLDPEEYERITKKVIYRFQRPSTQQEFASAVVDFLSQFRSKAARGAGADIYQWLYRDRQWKQARDLALLAIATYEGKNKQGETEVPEEILDQTNSEENTDESFERAID